MMASPDAGSQRTPLRTFFIDLSSPRAYRSRTQRVLSLLDLTIPSGVSLCYAV
jgi:hypothetical protein